MISRGEPQKGKKKREQRKKYEKKGSVYLPIGGLPTLRLGAAQICFGSDLPNYGIYKGGSSMKWKKKKYVKREEMQT